MLIVAEISANHNGSKEIAIETIKAIKQCGADAVKLQTYTADTITLNCEMDDFKIKQSTLWDGHFLYDLYKEAYTPWEWHEELFHVAKEEGLICFSSPFDKTAVDFLESLNNPIYKIASFEITDIPLISYVASKKKPIIISTGIAMISDIEMALEACKKAGNNDITLLKCTSSYPAPIEEANLLTILDMRERFNVKVGLSDHTMGGDVALAATVLGAEMIEKHFILDRSMGGPDSKFSMDKNEFKQMIQSIKNVEKALGSCYYPTKISDIKGRRFARSLYVSQNMKAGDQITEENVRSVRPALGLHPKYLSQILGKRVNKDIVKGTRLDLSSIEMENIED